MSDQSLIILDLAKRQAITTPECHELVEHALTQSALVCRVASDEDNAAAVEAHKSLKSVELAIEKARKASKEPILDLGRSIDAVAKETTAELTEEVYRIGRLTADWAALQAAKLRAAQEAARKDIAEAEAKAAQALAAAPSLEAQEQIKEDIERARYKASQRILAAEPVKADGQIVKTDWEIKVLDIIALSRAHPSCVKMEARLMDIKALLNAGVEVVGVDAKKVTTSTVRTSFKQIEA